MNDYSCKLSAASGFVTVWGTGHVDGSVMLSQKEQLKASIKCVEKITDFFKRIFGSYKKDATVLSYF
jgi:hypothetical protein